MVRPLLIALALAAVLTSLSCGGAASGFTAIAGPRQVVLHIRVVGSGGYDPNTPGLQADYMALQLPFDPEHYLAKAGDDQWFTWSTLFPKDFPTQRGWGVFAAWKGVGLGFDGEANLRFDVTDDELRLYVRGGNPDLTRAGNGRLRLRPNPRYGPRYEETYDLGPLRRGVWQTFYFHVHWSATPSGLVELYRAIDGGKPARLLAAHHVATLYADRPAVRYPIQDLYHKGAPNLGTVSDLYQTPMQWAGTLRQALASPSLQIAEGRWFGDRKSSGELVPAVEAPVPLPRRIRVPATAAG
jgi:hypothetical protein